MYDQFGMSVVKNDGSSSGMPGGFPFGGGAGLFDLFGGGDMFGCE